MTLILKFLIILIRLAFDIDKKFLIIKILDYKDYIYYYSYKKLANIFDKYKNPLFA